MGINVAFSSLSKNTILYTALLHFTYAPTDHLEAVFSTFFFLIRNVSAANINYFKSRSDIQFS